MATIVNDHANDGRPRTRQARLDGPSRRFDRRITAVRDDLADAMLAGTIIAPRYADGVHLCAVVPTTPLYGSPDDDAVAVSALLFGEGFIAFDVAGGWAWGQCLHDGYVGWVRVDRLAPARPAPASHVVAAAAAPVFAAPDIKARVTVTLPMNARLAVTGAGETFAAAAGGFVHRRHLRAINEAGADPAGIALGFVGTPYVWGGRTRDGIDCSGLTQAVLRACGVFCPRDSDQQAAAFAVIDPADRRRGDLVVFAGHVGILADADTLIHATAYWMTTVVEPLDDAIARVSATGFRRPPSSAIARSAAIAITPCSSP